MDWFVKALFGEQKPNTVQNQNDQKPSVSNDQNASRISDNQSIDLSQIITAKESEKIALKIYNEKHAETWNKNFEDCKKLVFKAFITEGTTFVECKNFMRPQDKQYIKETMTKKGYYIYTASEMRDTARNNGFTVDSSKFYMGRSTID
jgi:hypothetical protein